jgi:hypothetical protein
MKEHTIMSTPPKADSAIFALASSPDGTGHICWVTPRRSAAAGVALVLRPQDPGSPLAGNVPDLVFSRADALALADALYELCDVVAVAVELHPAKEEKEEV